MRYWLQPEYDKLFGCLFIYERLIYEVQLMINSLHGPWSICKIYGGFALMLFLLKPMDILFYFLPHFDLIDVGTILTYPSFNTMHNFEFCQSCDSFCPRQIGLLKIKAIVFPFLMQMPSRVGLKCIWRGEISVFVEQIQLLRCGRRWIVMSRETVADFLDPKMHLSVAVSQNKGGEYDREVFLSPSVLSRAPAWVRDSSFCASMRGGTGRVCWKKSHDPVVSQRRAPVQVLRSYVSVLPKRTTRIKLLRGPPADR